MRMTFGDATIGTKQEMIEFLHQAVDRGINFFDTAEVYGPFTNEELVGEALEPFKGQVVIATKFGFKHGDNGPAPGTGLDSRPEQIKRVADASLKRLLDTAAAYGNEVAVGNAIKRSGVARADLFVTTKLWIQDAGEGRTKQAFECSLARLQLDYLDLYLIHQPFGDVYGAWWEMEQLYWDGRVRAIGVSNFHPDRVMDLIVHNQVVPAVNQIETHPFNQRVETQKFLQENDVQIESWGTFAKGRNNMFENALLRSIADKHHKSVAQLILRWLTQRGCAVLTSPLNWGRAPLGTAIPSGRH